MPRRPAKNVPGTERYRDERRKGGGPRMHARGWHDHDEPHDLERVADNAGNDAVIEAESGGDRTGMGRRAAAARPTQTRERRKRTVPPSKGLSKRAAGKRGKAVANAKAGTRPKAGANMKAAKPMTGTRKKAAPKGPRRV
jgi:hypothetical protein